MTSLMKHTLNRNFNSFKSIKKNVVFANSTNLLTPLSMEQRSIRTRFVQWNEGERKRFREPKKEDGEYVTAGTLLASQYSLQLFPGHNVGIGFRKNLYARTSGRVMVTTERVNPNWDNVIFKLYYGNYENTDVPIYRTHYHVVAEPMPQTFKLVAKI